MAYIDDLMAQRNDPIGFSLRDRKQQVIDQKVIDKTARIDPAGLVQSDLLATYNASINPLTTGSGSSLLDFAKSSGYRALGNLGDAGRSITNAVLPTNFDNSAETGWSNQANADIAAGLSADARGQYDQDVQGVYQNIAQGNWWDAAKGSLALGPRVLADSAATIPELLAGTALTATGLGSGAGLALLGSKGRKAYQGVKAIGKGIDEAKANSKAFEMTANTLRSASNTSIMTADMVQQQVNEYKQANNGESPSSARVASMIAGNVAANMLQVGVLKNLFLPKIGGKPTLKKFKEEVSSVLEYAEEGTAKSLIKTVAMGIPKVLAAGGGEAAQEYIQSWVEILGVKMKPEEAGGLMASAYKEITRKENQDKAVLGAMLGFSAGATAKAVLGAPGVAAKATLDVAKGATKFTGRVIQDAGSRAAVAVLPPEKLQEIKADYEVQKAVVEESVKALSTKIDSISKAENVSQLASDSSLAPSIEAYKASNQVTDEQLADPAVFKPLRDELIRLHKADRTKLVVSFKASNLASMAKAAFEVNADRASGAVESVSQVISDSDAETVLGTFRDLSSAAVKAVKEIKSSTALGIIQMSSTVTADQTKSILEAAKNLELSDIARTAAVVKEKNPKLAAGLQSLATKMKNAQLRAGQTSKELLSSENMPEIIKAIAKDTRVSRANAKSLLSALYSSSKLRVKDLKALGTLESALTSYRNSSEGINNLETLKIIENRLQKARKRLSKLLEPTAPEAAPDVEAAVEPSTTEAVTDAEPSQTESAAVTPDDVSKAQEALISTTAKVVKSQFDKATSDESKDKILEEIMAMLKERMGDTDKPVRSLYEAAIGTLTESQVAIINKHYPENTSEQQSTVVTSENFDNIEAVELSEEEAKASYAKNYPGCKI